MENALVYSLKNPQKFYSKGILGILVKNTDRVFVFSLRFPRSLRAGYPPPRLAPPGLLSGQRGKFFLFGFYRDFGDSPAKEVGGPGRAGNFGV